MNILLLGPPQPHLLEFLASYGDTIQRVDGRLDPGSEELRDKDFLVSRGYRYILSKDVLEKFPRRIINLHSSFLPWNRGADPNLWSFLEDTPKGVSIHFIDEGIDTGDIIAQEEVGYESNDTFRTTYDRLLARLERLFMDVWPRIRSGRAIGVSQPPGGSFHRVRDKKPYEHLLVAGWDTPVGGLIGVARRRGA